MSPRRETFAPLSYLVFLLITLGVALLCICLGSVWVPPEQALGALVGNPGIEGTARSIIMDLRVPRVLAVALCGAGLSLCGAAMQGLLRNPLADGSTLGVSSGASLGAVLALAFGFTLPGLPQLGVMGMAIVFAFLSLLLILALAWRLDASLSTNTIILIGVIYSMFISALMSLVIAFSGPRLHSVTFWTMGSLAGAQWNQVLAMAVALALCSLVLLRRGQELNAFAVGEDNARSVGVEVKRVKLEVLIAVSVLIGVCVSIGGTIGFVGLVTPHAARLIVGPNHRRLLPATLFLGAIFLMLADLIARTLLSPTELPLGVVTSLIGALCFVMLFARTRRVK
jgi:iron complex transport system permease protein